MRLTVAQRSERGGRKRNEDAIGFCANETLGCFVLADGTGGYEGGALASETVVQQVLKHFSAAPRIDLAAIRSSIDVAREALNEARRVNPQFPHMDTTIVTLMLDTERALAYWSSIGDSRIYLFRSGRARTLTTDHSVLQSMIDAGIFTGELRSNQRRNLLYAAVGSEEVPERVVCDEPLVLRSGDIFLLCSDGLWDSVDEATMETLLQQTKNPEQWVDEMVRAVPDPQAPEQDNYSALAIWIGEREEVTTRILPVRPKDEKDN
ncbi:MAG: serine/threonine-protein phosphatase [Azoarcus sp.]|jgi:serine/threonine protein phosphatase PrpC|nr:serine/threonine-protein phosphatase [Azoarcus sp.]